MDKMKKKYKYKLNKEIFVVKNCYWANNKCREGVSFLLDLEIFFTSSNKTSSSGGNETDFLTS